MNHGFGLEFWHKYLGGKDCSWYPKDPTHMCDENISLSQIENGYIRTWIEHIFVEQIPKGKRMQ